MTMLYLGLRIRTGHHEIITHVKKCPELGILQTHFDQLVQAERETKNNNQFQPTKSSTSRWQVGTKLNQPGHRYRTLAWAGMSPCSHRPMKRTGRGLRDTEKPRRNLCGESVRGSAHLLVRHRKAPALRRWAPSAQCCGNIAIANGNPQAAPHERQRATY